MRCTVIAAESRSEILQQVKEEIRRVDQRLLVNKVQWHFPHLFAQLTAVSSLRTMVRMMTIAWT